VFVINKAKTSESRNIPCEIAGSLSLGCISPDAAEVYKEQQFSPNTWGQNSSIPAVFPGTQGGNTCNSIPVKSALFSYMHTAVNSLMKFVLVLVLPPMIYINRMVSYFL
jgi:hypothetical protein